MNGNPLRQVRPVSDRNSLYALRMVDTRANLLRAGSVIDNAALDKYSFTRDVYLQLRKASRASRCSRTMPIAAPTTACCRPSPTAKTR